MVKQLYKLLQKYGLYCLGIAVIILNFTLAFDNVVWGDEAFSSNTIYNTSLYGIYEKIYYWDSHPPLYYYWLRLVADILGYKTVAYHIASLIPFSIGIVMALTIFKKNFGKIPAAFFIVLSGLAAPCVEYNLEIRMYALVFLEILVCAFCSYKLIESNDKKYLWVLLTIFGVLAAYTHYYGLVVSGILLFVTVIFDVIRNRKLLRGLTALLTYMILYMPWVYIFISQTQRVGNSWWLTDIAPLSELTQMIFCGENLKGMLSFITIVFTLVIFIRESGIIFLSLEDDKEAITWKITRPNVANWSKELYAIILFWIVIVLTVFFTYVVSVLLNPMTVARYMYPLVPIMLFILMLCIRRVLAYGHVKWGNEEYGYVDESRKEGQISLFNTKSKCWEKTLFTIIGFLFMVIFIISLLDFKYYRSVSKTQEVETQKVLAIIDEPEDNAVFTAIGVKHLAWTILYYYFPEHEILDCLPNDVDTSNDEIWAFIGSPMTDEAMADMESKGYSVEVHLDLWFGKYGCNLYHFYR